MRQIWPDCSAFAVQAVAGGAVLGEERLAGFRVPGPGPQIIVESPDFGEFFFWRRPANIPPMLADECIEVAIAIRRDRKQFIHREVLGRNASSVHCAEEKCGPRSPGQECGPSASAHRGG